MSSPTEHHERLEILRQHPEVRAHLKAAVARARERVREMDLRRKRAHSRVYANGPVAEGEQCEATYTSRKSKRRGQRCQARRQKDSRFCGSHKDREEVTHVQDA